MFGFIFQNRFADIELIHADDNSADTNDKSAGFAGKKIPQGIHYVQIIFLSIRDFLQFSLPVFLLYIILFPSPSSAGIKNIAVETSGSAHIYILRRPYGY